AVLRSRPDRVRAARGPRRRRPARREAPRSRRGGRGRAVPGPAASPARPAADPVARAEGGAPPAAARARPRGRPPPLRRPPGAPLPPLLARPAAFGAPRLVYQVNYLGGAWRRAALNLLAWLAADAIVAYSADQGRRLARATWGLASRIVVVHPGLEPSEFAGA